MHLPLQNYSCSPRYLLISPKTIKCFWQKVRGSTICYNLIMENEVQKEKSQEQLYFSDLMKRHSSSLCQVKKVVESQTDKFQDQIQQGRYDIRKADTPVLKKRTHHSHQQVNLKDMLQLKRNLENKLTMLQSNLHQLNNSNELSPPQKVQLTKQQHSEFIRSMIHANKQLIKRKMDRRQHQQNQSQEKEEQQRRQQDELRIQKERKKKAEIEEKLKLANQLKERRQRELQAQNRVLSSLIQSKPLYQKLEENYSKFQLGSLEEKKRRLAEIRSFHKPISKEELDEHEKKFEALREKKEIQRQQRLNSESNHVKQESDVYRSQWHKKIMEESKTQEIHRKGEQQQQQQARQMRQKLRQYSEYVKANFKPQIDNSKAQKIKAAASEQLRPQINPQQVRKMGLDYLKFSKQQASTNKAMTQLNSTTSNNPPQPPKPINYLQELRKNRSKSNLETPSKQIQKIMSRPIDQKEKARLIVERVARLEQMARRKEELARASGRVVDQELDDIYLNTAKAKLALLN